MDGSSCPLPNLFELNLYSETFIHYRGCFQLDKRNVLYRKKLDSKNDGKSFEITEII